MDGMLSQDEINALLSGVDISGADDSAGASGSPGTSGGTGGDIIDEGLLTATEIDAIGEIANISMGSSATTLFSLVNRKVNITTPTVSLANWNTMIAEYERPCVFIQIKYTVGLDGSNILILKEKAASTMPVPAYDRYSPALPGRKVLKSNHKLQSGYFKGSLTKNVAPPPSVSSQPTLPFIIFASSSAILSPNPKFDLSVLDLSAQ